MYFNTEIKIDWEGIPSLLKNTYYELLSFYNENEEAQFSSLEEFFEASIKNCYIEGKITKQQQMLLFKVIGV